MSTNTDAKAKTFEIELSEQYGQILQALTGFVNDLPLTKDQRATLDAMWGDCLSRCAYEAFRRGRFDNRAILRADDLLTEAEIALERALCVLQDVTDDYFAPHLKMTERDKTCILYAFEDNGIKAEIVYDYLWRGHKKMMDAKGRLTSAKAAEGSAEA